MTATPETVADEGRGRAVLDSSDAPHPPLPRR